MAELYEKMQVFPVDYFLNSEYLLEEQVAARGYRAVKYINGPKHEAEAAELLRDQSPADLSNQELMVLNDAATYWNLDSAFRQHKFLTHTLDESSDLPDLWDVMTLAVDKTIDHTKRLSVDYDHLGEFHITKKRMAEMGVGMMATALTCSVLEDVTGSKPHASTVRSAKRMLKNAGLVYTSLLEAGHDPNFKSNPQASKALEQLQTLKLTEVLPWDLNRLTLFTKLLEPSSQKAMLLRDQNLRHYDISDTVIDHGNRVLSRLNNFLDTLNDEDVTKVLSSKDLLEKASVYLAREVDASGRMSFADAAKNALELVNSGRHNYRNTLGRIAWERGSERHASVPDSLTSKQAIFDAYTPEMRRIGIMTGGGHFDISQVYDAAADLLDTIYVSSDKDSVELPSYRDFYLFMANYLGVGPFHRSTIGISELRESEKDNLSKQLDVIYGLALEEQQDKKNCYGVDTEIFFVGRGSTTEPAKRVCRDCDEVSKSICKTIGMGQKFGIWAETSERQRRAERRAMNLPDLDDYGTPLLSEVAVHVPIPVKVVEEEPEELSDLSELEFDESVFEIEQYIQDDVA